ncbi:MAG: NAD-dependent epimerase/dehydratase family protein [Streptosporangiaceae bacterium]|nr:NAD-dependent epimerase/dehydratase family protein [Streptosporangiaceae bacterium]
MADELFGGGYAGRRVLVTGHTGFLGSWAVRWLRALGAEVAGFSRGQRTAAPSLDGRIRAFAGDVADAGPVAAAMAAFRPEIVLHLAGSTVVAAGFRSPAATFRSNVAGTVSVLDAATRQASVRCAVVTGTPAVAHLDDDLDLGPYPASKLAMEACVAAYAHGRTQQAAGRAEPLRLGLARPGVMIGGDWAEGRLLADVVRAIQDEQPVVLAAPEAVRPWQHVLDGVSGVLTLAARLWAGPVPRRRYEFGCGQPATGMSVRDLVGGFLAAYGLPGWPVRTGGGGAGDRLELGYAAAQADLGWRPVWDLSRALRACAGWYRAEPDGPDALAATMDDQITAYASLASHVWAAAAAGSGQSGAALTS